MQAAPSTIGRYQVLSELGQGGMGVVYLAQDPTLKRRVAIKCMLERRENDSAMARFQREAETSSRLNHPNVITVYDVGEDPIVGPFLAMEYVDGSSLATLITQESLSPEASFLVLTQATHALSAAHQAGIIHRDVKPDNLLVGKDGRVKLMDFGIALGDGARLTAVGDVLGSPSYTAPELLQGVEANPGTDLYALVVTAFEVVTGGSLPFQGNSLGATMYQIVHEPPTMPPDLDPHLVALFKKGMHKDPNERFRSMADFMTALAQCLHLPASLAASLGPVPRLDGPSGRGKSPTSQDEMRTSAMPARKSQAPNKATDPEGGAGHSLTAPPQDLLRHRSSGVQTPQTAHPSPTPAPAPIHHPKSAHHPPATPVPQKQGSLMGRLITGAAAAMLLSAGAWGWNFYSSNRSHSVKVETDPPFTQVFVDGVDFGTTPTNLTLKQSAKKMRLSQTGYETVTLDLSPETSAVSKSLKLKPNYFRVLTEPREAEVYLNGDHLDTSPIWWREFRGKAMLLRVEKRGFETQEIPFSPEKPLPEPIILKPKK